MVTYFRSSVMVELSLTIDGSSDLGGVEGGWVGDLPCIVCYSWSIQVDEVRYHGIET